jgi:hypothetical protein
MINKMELYVLLRAAANPRGKMIKPWSVRPRAIRRAICLIIISVCFLETSGCWRAGVQTIWSAEARSPDGSWLATARTEQYGGFGTGRVETDVYLKWIKGSQAPKLILMFFHDPNDPPRLISLSMKWITPSQLDVEYNGRAKVDFQVVKYGDVYISLHDLSGETANITK